MASGGKGGSTSSSVQIPDWIKEPAQRNLARAEQASQIGYMPYYGPDVAALTPQQLSSMQASNMAAQAFGLAPKGQSFDAGVPQAQEFAGGVRGYSSAPLFNQAVQELAAKNPTQFAKYNSLYDGQFLNQNPSTAGKYAVASDVSGGGGAASNTGSQWGWGSPMSGGVSTYGSPSVGTQLGENIGGLLNAMGWNTQNPNNAAVVDMGPTSSNFGNTVSFDGYASYGGNSAADAAAGLAGLGMGVGSTRGIAD